MKAKQVCKIPHKNDSKYAEKEYTHTAIVRYYYDTNDVIFLYIAYYFYDNFAIFTSLAPEIHTTFQIDFDHKK